MILIRVFINFWLDAVKIYKITKTTTKYYLRKIRKIIQIEKLGDCFRTVLVSQFISTEGFIRFYYNANRFHFKMFMSSKISIKFLS